MKSVKPGRGPSLMEGIVSLFVAGVGVAWTIAAVAMGAGFMAFFGIAFIVIAAVNAFNGFYSAAAQNRPSIVDIVDSEEESDPLAAASSRAPDGRMQNTPDALSAPARFCPYCGASAEKDHNFCARCGKPLS